MDVITTFMNFVIEFMDNFYVKSLAITAILATMFFKINFHYSPKRIDLYKVI